MKGVTLEDKLEHVALEDKLKQVSLEQEEQVAGHGGGEQSKTRKVGEREF